jgi:hypothetical protein
MTGLQITISAAIAVSIIGGTFSVVVAVVGGRYLLASKREERIAKQEAHTLRERLEDVYSIVQHAPEGYEWLVVNKYTHLDKLHTGFTVVDPVRQEEFISDGLCVNLGRTRAQWGKKVVDVARFVPAQQVQQYGHLIAAMIDERLPSFEMVKHIRDGKDNERVFNVKTVQDGVFILSVYEEKK